MKKHPQVIVVGAGPVGLLAALALAKQDVSVLVLEAEPGLTADLRAGRGRASTDRCPDKGPDRLPHHFRPQETSIPTTRSLDTKTDDTKARLNSRGRRGRQAQVTRGRSH